MKIKDLSEKQLQAIKNFISWIQSDEISEDFKTYKKYVGTELAEDKFIPESFFIKKLGIPFQNKTEFFESRHVDGNKHKVKILTRKGEDFIRKNLIQVNNKYNLKLMFIQDFTLRTQNGVDSVIGGNLVLYPTK